MNAPVVLFVYNRVKHTQQTLEALMKNRNASKTCIYIYSDAAKDETEQNNVVSVRDYLEQIAKSHPFEYLEIIKQTVNQGLEKSIINGVTKIINQYGRIIVLEDDIVTTPDFLDFMNGALDNFKNDSKVWSISGYTLYNKRIEKCKEDILWSYRGECEGGWATWSDRWETVDWLVEDYELFIHNKTKQKEFNRAGKDMTDLLVKQHNGEISSWAIRWCYQQFKENMITLFPKHPKSINIGWDGSGTNCSSEEQNEVKLFVEKEWNYKYNLQDNTLLKQFQKKYSKIYMRQMIGKYWYLLTEYEYCLAYRWKQDDYFIMKPSPRYWYADPIPVMLQGHLYVFVEMYDKLYKMAGIGLCEINKEHKLERPRMIISEHFHLSFPYVYEYKDAVYMIPETSGEKQLRIYKMNDTVYHWKLYVTFDTEEELVDTVIYETDEHQLKILTCVVNSENKHQTKLRQYAIKNIEDKEKLQMEYEWEQNDFSYDVRNGGRLYQQNGLHRVVQRSTSFVYGKDVIIKKIGEINNQGMEEKTIRKITLNTENVILRPFIYLKHGIHTYGCIEGFEIIDVLVQRFSLSGLFYKIIRRI